MKTEPLEIHCPQCQASPGARCIDVQRSSYDGVSVTLYAAPVPDGYHHGARENEAARLSAVISG